VHIIVPYHDLRATQHKCESDTAVPFGFPVRDSIAVRKLIQKITVELREVDCSLHCSNIKPMAEDANLCAPHSERRSSA
jgi:hypothetical protein